MVDNKYCFTIDNLDFSIDGSRIIKSFSAKIKDNEITTIIGQNGCGKSTLLQLLTKAYKKNGGDIFLRGENVENIKGKNFARQVAIVNQYNVAPRDISVKQLVGYGRIPHKQFAITTMSKEDEQIIDWALEITGLNELADKDVSSLSGGQRQRVWIAMALAQNTGVLFLDEPTTYLDIKYQLEILNIVKKLNEEHSIAIVMVLHDINQAIKYSHNIIAMKNGEVYKSGDAKKIVDKNLIKEVYDVDVDNFSIDGIDYIVNF